MDPEDEKRTDRKVARKAGRSPGKREAWQEAHATNVCNQVKNRKKNEKKLERAKERLDIGEKLTARNNSFEDAVDALLIKISDMSSVSGLPFEGQTHIHLSRPKAATSIIHDMETDILDGISLCVKDNF